MDVIEGRDAMQLTSLVINGVVAVLSWGAWLQMALGFGILGKLEARGLRGLKYFTVLSNLFSGLICALYFCSSFGGRMAPLWIIALKLVSSTGVMLTFITVVVLLCPKYGWKSMYEGSNFWLHLVLPLLAAIDCCLFVPLAQLSYWVTLLGAMPTTLYGIWYLAMVLKHGAEENGKVYDFYGFLRWGEDKILIVTVAMHVVTWMIALALRLGSQLLFIG